jgi:glucosamine-6-phosphate deaminase
MGGVDIQLLGIGNNGHIGFNEPDDHFTKGTNVVDLTESTIDANSRFFASRDLVPTRAISMGVGQIMKAKKILLIALGRGKAEILERSLFGPVTPAVPASILQFAPDVTVCADEAALSVILEKHPEAVTRSRPVAFTAGTMARAGL